MPPTFDKSIENNLTTTMPISPAPVSQSGGKGKRVALSIVNAKNANERYTRLEAIIRELSNRIAALEERNTAWRRSDVALDRPKDGAATMPHGAHHGADHQTNQPHISPPRFVNAHDLKE